MTGEVAAQVAKWFEDRRAASLELPDGWFGRPFDNQHELTWWTERSAWLFIELDGAIQIIVVEPELRRNDADKLVLAFRRAVLDWEDFGSTDGHHTYVYGDGGEMAFHAW